MKKLIISLVLAASVAFGATAQEYKNSWGVSLGYENSINEPNYTTFRYFHAFNVGASYKAYLWKGLSIYPDIRFQVNDNYGSTRQIFENHTLVANKGFCSQRWHFYLQFRPMVAYRYKWFEVYTGPRLNVLLAQKREEMDGGGGDVDKHRTEMYWSFGVAGYYRNFSLGVGFNQPLYPSYTKIREKHQAPRTIDLSLTYRFKY